MLLVSDPAHALVSYSFDFGTTAYTGSDGGPAGLALSSGDWVYVGADGAAGGPISAGGLTLDFGRGVGSTETSVVSWATAVKEGTMDFAAPSRLNVAGLYEDGLGGSVSRQSILGLRVTGLAAGEYEVFATAFIETSTNLSTATGSVWLGTGDSNVTQAAQIAAAASRPWSGFNSNSTTFVSSAGAWNYISNRVTVTAGGYVVLIAQLPFSSGAQQVYEPILSTLQLVAIPEPSSSFLVGAGLLAVLYFRRRCHCRTVG